jgi:DNA polymerase-3 subunit chi
MTRIDFHSNIADKIGYACRLVRKARAAEQRVVLLAKSPSHLAALDDALWTFSELDFLPHVSAASPLAGKTPVVLTDNDSADLPHYQILINLAERTPSHFARFERMFELIGADDGDKAAGRERYRFYQQRGYSLTHNVADQS